MKDTSMPSISRPRLKQAGLPAHYSPHSSLATGITNFLENDGTLEAAQRIAGHADSQTTKLYGMLTISDRKSPLGRFDRIRSSMVRCYDETKEKESDQ
jgi:hypothetical protein